MLNKSNPPPSVHDLVVGVDPGRKRSGFVAARVWPTLGITIAGRLTNPDVCDFLWSEPVVELFVEDFRLRPWALASMRWNTLQTVRMIGALEEIARRRRIRLLLVEPAAAKRFATDQLLIDLGTWSRNAHVNDAFRVLWYGLFRRDAAGIAEVVVDERIVKGMAWEDTLSKKHWEKRTRERRPSNRRK